MLPTSPSGHLKTGRYFIKNDGATIARRLLEDVSLNPKAIIKHRMPIRPDLAVWDLENVGSHPPTYIVSIGRDYTAPVNDIVYAIMMDIPPAEKWIIEAVPQHGPNKYIIWSHNGEKGWLAPYAGDPGSPLDQILCRPLFVEPSDPSRYPPFEVFEITPAI